MISVILTGGQLFSTAFDMVAGFITDRMGRRRILVFFGLLVTFSGIVFATVSTPMVLIPDAVITTLGSRGGSGPANMLKRVILAQSYPEDRRTRMYAIRSTFNSVTRSVGSLFVGVVELIQGWFGPSKVTAYRLMFGVYAILNYVAHAVQSLSLTLWARLIKSQ